MLSATPRLLKILEWLRKTDYNSDEITLNRIYYTKNPVVLKHLGHLPDKGFDTLVVSMSFGIFLKTESYEDEYGRWIYYSDHYPIRWNATFAEEFFEWFLEERLVHQAEQKYKEQQHKRYLKKMNRIREEVKLRLESELHGE